MGFSRERGHSNCSARLSFLALAVIRVVLGAVLSGAVLAPGHTMVAGNGNEKTFQSVDSSRHACAEGMRGRNLPLYYLPYGYIPVVGAS